MRHLSIDLETYSSIDIKKSGAYAYVRSPDFQILLNGYQFLGEMPNPKVLDYTQEDVLPKWFVDCLFAPNIIKHAYNAAFEWMCFSRVLGVELPKEQWRDTMLHSLYCGYPASLEASGKAVGLLEDKQKLKTGKDLIKYFCTPCKPSKANGQRARNYPHHNPEKWQMFKDYNAQDVITESEISRRLSMIPVPDYVQRQWETDLKINSRGVAVDMELVNGALNIGQRATETLRNEAIGITGLNNPNSVKQLSEWLRARTNASIDNLSKATVSELKKADNPPDVQRMLEIRQELGKTSTKKYDAIKTCVCPDGRVRGLLQFYGANRTGRWAGRLVQVQNLPRTYTEPLELARELIKGESLDGLHAIYGSVNDTLSQLIRTAFISSEGNILIDADFSAIEARVISWLAGEEWRLKVFRTHGKIYEASAAQMFGVPIERIKKGNPEYALRAKGKVAELALGYQGGAGALIAMGALNMGLHEDELPDIVTRWRESNSNIQNLWWEFNNAAIEVIKNGGVKQVRCCAFALEGDIQQNRAYMTIQLPSGRKLYYANPSLGANKWGGQSIIYSGMNQTSKKWESLETYGGKLVENCVQAIARDCLAEAIERLEAAGYPVVFHIHDEVVIDIKPTADPEIMLNDVIRIMSMPIPWAQGLPLGADGWTGKFFRKD
jgi:DNA polymerase